MSFETVNSSYQGARNISNAQKRELLWNILEPGDPYDIKKSLIAKLPGDRKHFMGDSLEIVCLFQAAEIERLIENLDQYKLKYKEIERRELDRHSYEIQIKELAQQLSETDGIRNENLRLKDFIRRQNGEIEDLKKRVADIDVNLQKKYDNALNQIETMYAENNMLKAENSNLRNEIMSWRSRLEALDKARIKELEELRGSMSVLHRSQVDREMRELTARYNQERSQLEAEIKRLRDILEVKTRELDDWRSKASALETRVNDLQSKTGQNIQMENRIAELENKLALFSQEIERLNLQLKERNNEILELNKRYKIIDLEVQKKDNELREHFRRSGALEQETDRMKQLVAQLQARSGQNPELEAKLVKMSEEIERLNSVLKLSTTEKMELSTRLNRLEFEYESLRKNTTSDITLVKTQYESKIGVLNQEIDRLGQENRNVMTKYSRLELEASKLSELDRLNRSNSELQGTISRLNSEVIELRRQLSVSVDEATMLRRRLDGGGDVSKRIPELESTISGLRQENQRLIEANRKWDIDFNSKLTVYTRKEEEYRRAVQELELRIQQVIGQNDSLKRNAEEAANSRITVIEQKFITVNRECEELRRENGELRRKLQDGGGQSVEFERRIAVFSQEIERLNGILKLKVDEGTSWQAKYRQIAGERDELNRMAHELQRRLQESGSLAQRVAESDNRIASLNQEVDRLTLTIRTKVEQYNVLETRVRQITTERDGLLRNVSDQQRRMMDEAEGKLSSLGQEIERLNSVMQRVNSQLNQYKSRYNQSNDENNTLKRKLQELQLKLDSEIRSRTSTFEQRTIVLTQESEQLKRRVLELENQNRHLVELENKAALMSQEIERLNRNIGTVVQENEDLRRKIVELQNINRKAIELQSRLTMLTQQNDRLNQTIEQRNRDFSGLSQKLGEVEVLTRNMNMLQERVNALINENRTLVEELRVAKEGLRTATGQVSRFNQESEQQRRRIQELENSSRRLIEYESKISSMNMDVERLTTQLRQSAEFQNQLLIVSREKETLILETQRLQESLRQAGTQNNRFMSDYKELQNTLGNFRNENEDLKRKLIELNDSARQLHEFQSKLLLVTQDNDRLNQLVEQRTREVTTLNQRLVDLDTVGRNLRDMQNRVNELTAENKHLHDEYNLLQENARNAANQGNRAIQELNDLKSRTSIIVQQNDQLKRKLMEMQSIYNQMSGVENRAAQLSIEIERLNGVLREKLNEINAYQRELSQYKSKFPQLVEENNNLKLRFQELTQQFEAELRNQVTTVEKKYTVLNQDFEQLKRRNIELENTGRKAVEYESRLTMLQPEIERMNSNMQIVTTELSEYKIKFSQLSEENVSLKRRVQDTTQEANSRLGQMGQETDQLKRRIIELENSTRTIADLENRTAMLSNEINRLNEVLRQKIAELQESEGGRQKLTMELNQFRQRYPGLTSENEELRRKLPELAQQYEKEINNRTALYEQRITTLSREIEQMRRKLGDSEGLNRRIVEYENRIGIMTQEIQRLNMKLAEKVEQLSRLDADWTNKYKQLESGAYEYEQRLSKYVEEIERLNLLLRQKVELETRSAQLIQEIERLNNALRIKVQESQQWQQKGNQISVRFTELAAEYERLQNLYNQLVRDAELSKRQRIEHEQKFARITTEFEKLHQIIKDLKEENYRLKVELGKQDFQNIVDKNHFLAGEIDRLNAVIQQLNQDLSELRIRFSDETSLQKRIQEHMALFVVLFAEIESLRKRVKDKEKEVEQVRRTSLAPYRV